MGRIARLSDELVDKIAAGEVVERPASVVKELCENALDAGATQIRVSLERGGTGRICVADDGCGMGREDALLALERHATSKLRDLEGLSAIRTMGFRGEALPSIAAVSRFSLTTSEKGAAVGTRVCAGGGAGIEVEDAAPSGGTVVEVEDLFFNTPARRKYLKREETELRHCQDAVARLALAHPDVAFSFEHGGRPLLSARASADGLRERLAQAVDPLVHPHLVEVDERRLGIHVHGLVATGDFTLSTARGVYTFVLCRYIRDRGVNHALQRAFRESLPPGRQPVAALFIEIDPSQVDVNVHPQKLEVRFADPRGVYDAVYAGVSRALWPASAPVGPGIAPADPMGDARYALAVERFLSRAQEVGALVPAVADVPFAARPGQSPAFGQARPGINEAPPQAYFSHLRLLGALAGRFWLCEGQGGTLVVVDPHAARERVELSRLRGAFGQRGGGEQGALFAQTLEVPAALHQGALDRREALALLQVEVDAFGGASLRVQGLPPGLSAEAAAELLGRLVQALPRSDSPAHPDAYADALRALACASAGADAREPAAEEWRALMGSLDRAEFAAPARHAAVVVMEIPLLELERRSGG